MLKIFLIVAGIILIGFLIMDDSYNFSIQTMGYEYSFSIALLIIGLIILFYALHFIKTPVNWIKNYKNKRFQKNMLKKENFLTLVLTTVLDKNNVSEQTILLKEKKLFAKGSSEQLLFEALFNPSESVFERLKKNKATELAGLRGLYLSAKEKGDIDVQTQILETIAVSYPTVLWARKEALSLQLLQSDWNAALVTLEILNKQKGIASSFYTQTKACILYGLKHYKEAFTLYPNNPAFAWAYAATDPKKAEEILKKSWNLTPAWETYTRYYELIKSAPSAKQMKYIEKFVATQPDAKLSLLAIADTAMQNHLWGVAKEILQKAMNSFSPTRQMALMMADLERNGWHHEEAAKEWEEKAMHLEQPLNWVCKDCHHTSDEWDNKCPVCNACGGLTYHG
ncbi:MAG: hypothetical protein IKY98_03700 [Alphaproteobacteria bacterium]|nr:hypothetical protein [Alphaproteobacteria bacterium]